jgi:hypothetical protein
VLSPLQEQVARLVARLPEAEDFALAAGAALISRGDVARHTQDLDFFGLEPSQVDRLRPAVVDALQRAGLEVQIVREAPAADARLLPPQVGPLGATLSAEELAVDKVLAVFGRAQARDFVDLSALEPRYGLEGLFRLAKEKDPGFDTEVFAQMLSRFDRLRRDEFELNESSYANLREQIGDWQARSLALRANREMGQAHQTDGRDLGLGR